MDAKFILQYMVMVNLIILIFSSFCISANSSCTFSENLIIPKFFVLDSSTDYGEAGSIAIASSFQGAVSAMLTPQAAGAKITEGFSLFLDALKMTLGIIVLLTPFPIFDLFNGFGIPLVIILPIGIAAFFGYFLGILELMRGANFGK